MAKNKYYDFFNNYESLTETTKNKKLQKLSNNFDLNILTSLWNDYNKYLESKGCDSLYNFDFVEVEEFESDVQIKFISNLKTLYLEDNVLRIKRYKTGAFTDIEVVQNIELIKHLDNEISKAYDELKNKAIPKVIQSQKITIKPPKLIGNKLSINQIALKCFYEGKIITRENAKEQLNNTEYKSGDKLYNVFSKWSNTTDRKADPESKVKLNNKIQLFESVIELLPEEKKSMANDDLKILTSFISKY